ncbi:MAG: DUF2063 domain-containing protein [Candidatus Competibacterales bacterium]
MPSLGELQQAFADALWDPQRPTPVVSARTVATTRRFNVYRNNVMVSLCEALGATFPAVKALVGEAFFGAVAKLYIAEEPPRSPLLMRYGQGFGAFLDRFPPAQTVPYLGDVARLEWSYLQSYHAADAEPLTLDALAGLDPNELPHLGFRLHPSLALLTSPYPVVSLWSASLGHSPREAVDMKRRENAIVVRPALTVTVYPVTDGASWHFFQQLATGGSLQRAAEAGMAAEQDFDLAAQLQRLFAWGCVAGLQQPR